jgi:predicted MPP superfamily phosphohydrolase
VQHSAAYAHGVFWFWFWVFIGLLMLVLNGIWWAVAMRLTRRKLWRVVVSVFMVGQIAAHVSLMADFNWPLHSPKPVLVTIILWHWLGLGLVFAILVTLAMLRARARMGRDQRIATPANATSQSRREFIGACAALAPPLFTIGLTAAGVAQLNSFRVRRFTLSIPTLPRVLDGITIAHVSDMHVGRLTSGRMLRDMVDATNAFRADLVVLTGDLINLGKLADLSEAIQLVKALEARYGLWMVEGNHDLAEDGSEFERRVKAAGVPLLLDDSSVANVRGYPVQLFGLSWLNGGGQQHDRLTAFQVRTLMKQRRADAFPILLAHHPHAFDAAAKARLPLTLAGHTHGGQLMFDRKRGVGPALFRYWSGLYKRDGSQMVVSNGIGNWFPIRINAPAELVHITLRCG